MGNPPACKVRNAINAIQKILTDLKDILTLPDAYDAINHKANCYEQSETTIDRLVDKATEDIFFPKQEDT